MCSTLRKGLELLTGELRGSYEPSGVVFTVLATLSGMEREYIRDRTLEGHESARARVKSIGVTDEAMLAAALHLHGQEMSLRDIAGRLVIARQTSPVNNPQGTSVPGFRPSLSVGWPGCRFHQAMRTGPLLAGAAGTGGGGERILRFAGGG